MKLSTGALCTAAVAVCAGALIAGAQQSDQPTFRTTQTLVEFTVVATGSDGKPVSDLRQDELVVTENGKPRPVSFFRFEGTGRAPGAAAASAAPPPALEPGLYTNRSEYTPGPPRNITAIVIDSLNTRSEDQTAVREQVVRYLRTIEPGTRIAVYRAGDGVHVIHDFTDDIASLRLRIAKLGIEEFARQRPVSAVEKVREPVRQGQLDDPQGSSSSNSSADSSGSADGSDNSQGPDTLHESMMIADEEMARVEEYYNQATADERSNLTLLALESISNHLAAIPGRKNLIWISGGTPTLFAGVRDPWPKSYEKDIRAMAQRIASEGIAMYPVVATGLTSVDMATSSIAKGSGFGQATDDVKSNLHPQANIDDLRMLAGMEQFAEITGGRVSKNTNDLVEGVRLAANDIRGSYSIGFYSPDPPDDRWHDVRVRTTRPGVRVLTRRGTCSRAVERAEELGRGAVARRR